MRVIAFILFICISFGLKAQNEPAFTSSEIRIQSAKDKLSTAKNSLYKNIEVKNIGPTVQSGRIVDLEVHPKDHHIFYVAYASGGLWKTENNGASFTPLFDHEMVMTIGDFDVNWETNEIFLGTGEVNSSRSSYSGIGLYYSYKGKLK